jgi:hypothetical protein
VSHFLFYFALLDLLEVYLFFPLSAGKRLTCEVYRAIDKDPRLPMSFTTVTTKLHYDQNYGTFVFLLIPFRILALFDCQPIFSQG